MSSKKLLKRDKRGGRRENAGRKSIWKNKDTITIRVPKAIAFEVIELAHRLDSGQKNELDTESKLRNNDLVTKTNIEKNEKVTESKSPEDEKNTNSNSESPSDVSDFVTKSIPSYSQAIEIAKKILKSKKSARISIAKIISKLYKKTLSPDDLKL